MSAETRARKVGVAAPPEVGPANTVLAVSVASVIANVPLVVIGEPETDKKEGTVSPTEVTVPDPPPCGGHLKLPKLDLLTCYPGIKRSGA